MPITLADKGQQYIVQRISGRDDVRRHLENLGVVVGALITVVAESPAVSFHKEYKGLHS